MTNLYLISGFLGAGKTTLIQKLLKEHFSGSKTALIENDFGEISIDAAILRSGSVKVREINSGCICCSLSGDFTKALEELLCELKPENVLIEPSGVGKLSDIEKSCRSPKIASLASVRQKITVVDVQRCHMYLENFGEFFEDQIHCADTVILSHLAQSPEKIRSAEQLVRTLNPHVQILSTPLTELTAEKIFGTSASKEADCCTHHHGCTHEHCTCGSGAEDAFQTVTVHTNHEFTKKELEACFAELEVQSSQVLRVKGIVRGKRKFFELQYVPRSLEIKNCKAEGSAICIIGRNLPAEKFREIFCGE